jgi:hypothetical protein
VKYYCMIAMPDGPSYGGHFTSRTAHIRARYTAKILPLSCGCLFWCVRKDAEEQSHVPDVDGHVAPPVVPRQRNSPDSEAHSMESHVPSCHPFGSRYRDGTYYCDGNLGTKQLCGLFQGLQCGGLGADADDDTLPEITGMTEEQMLRLLTSCGLRRDNMHRSHGVNVKSPVSLLTTEFLEVSYPQCRTGLMYIFPVH